MNHQGTKNTKAASGEQVDVIAHSVIGAGIEVHRILGPGFLESTYEDAMAVELNLRGLAFERQKLVNAIYKGHHVGQGRIDLLVEDSLVVELKTVERIAPIHRAQLISYLKATGYRLGLLLNFNEIVLRDGIQRIIRD